jgi:signal transduction histidine kinase/CheY-like chemotaxis protein
MERARWPNLPGGAPAAANFLGEIARAAVAGEPLRAILEMGAGGLLELGQGDRAGVWLAPVSPVESAAPWQGAVVEPPALLSPGKVPRRQPEEWRWLDFSVGFLRALAEGQGATVSGVSGAAGLAGVPQLDGMRSVVWLPLRVRSRALGLAMVSYREAQTPVHLAGLEALASELALAVAEAFTRNQLAGATWKSMAASELGPASADAFDRLEGEFSTLLAGVESGVLVLDEAGRVRFANARLSELLGLTEAPPSRLRSFSDLAGALGGRLRHRERFRPPEEELAAPGNGSAGVRAVRREIELTGPDSRLVERAIFPVRDRAGRERGWLELYRDVTGQRLLQSKLLQTEKMAAIGQLVSGIAHELNNPLTGILGYAQLLLGRGLGRAQQGEAQKIYEEAERASRIVKNLLLFARETQPERLPVDLNEVVERALALRSYELKVEDIAVVRELDPGLPQTRADPIQLQQVVLNLLVNAEQAILEGRGHGTIRVRTARRGATRLALEVSDDGCGIDARIASRIFDPFFTTKPPGVGTGLGLSIVYGIVQQHGGEITVESAPGRGAAFTVELPMVEAAREAFSERAAAPLAPVAVVERSRRILVVEDEPTVAQLIAEVLGGEGHRVDAVLDSQEGLSRLAREKYDLVICDLRMPRLDGQAFHRALVESGSGLDERLLFVTGDTLAPRTRAFLDRSGVPCLPKPFLVEELKLAVNRVLEPGAVSSPARQAAGRLQSGRNR